MKETAMKLYILNEVLFDYTPGMAVIAAPNVERMMEIFADEFPNHVEELKACMEEAFYQELEVVNQPEGLVTYVYGGG